jgi:glucosamine kinase
MKSFMGTHLVPWPVQNILAMKREWLEFRYLIYENAFFKINKDALLMQHIFIGVDGGGTCSRIRVEDGRHQLIGHAVGGAACISISVDEAWQRINAALSDILTPHGISLDDKQYRFHASFGLSGCEVKEAYHDFLNRPHPFSTLILTSDAHIACLGAHHGHDGAIIIVGTGIVGYKIEAGNGSKVSGWGFSLDDEGAGAWLGSEAVRLTCQWLDHRVEASPLAADVFAFFDQDIDQFVTWANRANSTEFARLAPLVIHHSRQEETAALGIMKKAAHAVDRIGHTLMKSYKNNKKVLPCCLLGGIAPFLEPLLSEALRETLVTRQADANTGAILMLHDRIKEHGNCTSMP